MLQMLYIGAVHLAMFSTSSSTHPLHFPQGSSIIRMLEGFVGREKFKEGLSVSALQICYMWTK